MKIIYFVANGRASDEDMVKVREMRGEGHKVVIANGSMPYGFQDRCDAVYLSCDAPHVEKWADGAGIEVMKPAVAVEPEPEPEPVKRKPAAKRGPKPKPETVADDKPADEEEGAE